MFLVQSRDAGKIFRMMEVESDVWRRDKRLVPCGGRGYGGSMWMWIRSFLFFLCCAAVADPARADSVSGTTWAVRFNRPDQTTTLTGIGPEEYVIREAYLARIDALQSQDWGCLTAFTFSGNSEGAGAAGPVLLSMSNALSRGARLAFVADNGVNIASNYWPGISLTGLSMRAGNKLELRRAPNDSGIMHDKVGVFWYRAQTQAWVLTGSWNFTGGASSQQWNILAEVQNNALATAYSNEMRQMLNGYFHASAAKSHAHDGTRFRLPGSGRDSWVRFAPYPDKTYGGSNALTDVVAAIDAATNTIVFALNKLTRPDVVSALIRACNRGVKVNGTIPKSDRSLATDDSYAMYQMLIQPTNYATANRVMMYNAYSSTTWTNYDAGQADLTHTKYMVIDPYGPQALVIHGSPNWTEAALVDDSSNDENLLFLVHEPIARSFVAQFNAMTDGVVPWCDLRSTGSTATARCSYWLPYTNRYALITTTNLFNTNSWTSVVTILPTGRGTNSVLIPRSGARGFYRIQKMD